MGDGASSGSECCEPDRANRDPTCRGRAAGPTFSERQCERGQPGASPARSLAFGPHDKTGGRSTPCGEGSTRPTPYSPRFDLAVIGGGRRESCGVTSPSVSGEFAGRGRWVQQGGSGHRDPSESPSRPRFVVAAMPSAGKPSKTRLAVRRPGGPGPPCRTHRPRPTTARGPGTTPRGTPRRHGAQWPGPTIEPGIAKPGHGVDLLNLSMSRPSAPHSGRCAGLQEQCHGHNPRGSSPRPEPGVPIEGNHEAPATSRRCTGRG